MAPLQQSCWLVEAEATRARRILVRRAADHRAARDLDLPLRLQKLERWFNDGERKPKASPELAAGHLSGEMQRLEGQLDQQVEAESRLHMCERRTRESRRDVDQCGRRDHVCFPRFFSLG